MKRVTITFSIVAALVGARISLPALAAQVPQSAARDYIVVFHDDERDVPGLAAAHGQAYGASVSHLYQHAIKGYAATVSQARIDDIRRDPRVAFVSEDRPVQAVAQSVPTGISNRRRTEPAPGTLVEPRGAVTTPAVGRSDLNVVGGTNCSTGRSYVDGNGHGTHVAEPLVREQRSRRGRRRTRRAAVSVRVLNNQGSGSWSSVICGLD